MLPVEEEWELSNLPPARRPDIYTCPAVRSACRGLQKARHASETHYLRLTDAELLHLHSALSQERSRTRKAIGKGLCKPGDLRATNSVWEKLQVVYFGRVRRSA